MAAYRAAVRAPAAEVIRRLPPGIKRAVRSAIGEGLANPASGEPLHGELDGFWKYRVRRFRVIYQVDREKRLVNVLAVGERRSIYEEVAELLRSQE
jgi:mRNA interferase RelE/StbE